MYLRTQEFLKEMKDITGQFLLYAAEHWVYSNIEGIHSKYSLSCGLDGFRRVEKDTEEELINSFPLIKDQLLMLLKAKAVGEQLQVKLLSNKEVYK